MNKEQKVKGYFFISNSSKPGMIVPEPTEIDIDNFSHSAIYAADKLGYKIYMGYNVDHPENLTCKQYDITYFHANIYRNPLAIRDNYKAYKILCKFIKKHPDIEVIHCNTPIGGVIGRIVGHKFKKKVIYTAHGFHFYKGAPLLNWLIFYPIEKFLSKWTDVLITINKEDYIIAQSFMKKRNKKAYYVPGVGVELDKFSNCNTELKNIREELSLSENDILLTSVGRLDKNKNHCTIIKAISKTGCENLHLIVCGEGEKKSELIKLANSLRIQDKIHLLGNRSDIPEILAASDIYILASYREGLSRSIMEAMASGLPCLVSDIRGNRDLIESGKGGMLFSPTNDEQLASQIDSLSANSTMRDKMGEYNKSRVTKFSIDASKKAFADIFEKELNSI